MRSNQSNRKAGDQYEEYLAEKLNGEIVRGSGSGKTKGDVKVGQFLIQVKRTDRDSFSINEKTLQKTEEEAMNQGRKPALAIGFWHEDRPKEEWVAVPLWLFRQFIDMINKDSKSIDGSLI